MIILASKSPRRRQILAESGLEFTVKHIEVDESYPVSLQKQEVALYLSLKKAEHYHEDLEDNVLICADTIVCVDSMVLNKPEDASAAFDMLKILSGRMHEVYTGITLRKNENYHSFFARTEVYFYELTEAEIETYIHKFKPYDKAGAYGIQEGIGYTGIQKINGCFYNVMGLPLSLLCRELQAFDPVHSNQNRI